MPRLFVILFSIFIFLPGYTFAGNKVVTERYMVAGNCDQCKARIEKAAYDVKGVRFAGWDVGTGELTLKYDSTKTSATVILKNIAEAGHDNSLFTAGDASYNQLPECCRYRSAIKKH